MMDDDDLQRVYQWVDEIPLSRPKRNIARDFSDESFTRTASTIVWLVMIQLLK